MEPENTDNGREPISPRAAEDILFDIDSPRVQPTGSSDNISEMAPKNEQGTPSYLEPTSDNWLKEVLRNKNENKVNDVRANESTMSVEHDFVCMNNPSTVGAEENVGHISENKNDDTSDGELLDDCQRSSMDTEPVVDHFSQASSCIENKDTIQRPEDINMTCLNNNRSAEMLYQKNANLQDQYVDTTVSECVCEPEHYDRNIDVTVSLSNIIIQQKDSQSDSDSEFDFELRPVEKKDQTDSVMTVNSNVPIGIARSGNVSVAASGLEVEPYKAAQKPMAVIKPTTVIKGNAASLKQQQQIQTNVHVLPTCPLDSETQHVLEVAQAQWDNVTTIQAGFMVADKRLQGAVPMVVETVMPMSPQELENAFRIEDFSSVKPNIRPTVEKHGFASFVNLLFGPPKLHRNLHIDRDRVFCIAASQLCNDNNVHLRTLQTIFRCLTGSKFDCPRFGSHWEEIGFQGTDPATDLRGTGMLSLMNLLHLLKDPRKHMIANDIYKLSLHPTQNFPFCVMSINLTRITLQTFREELLNKQCNQRCEVFGVINDFYTGLYLYLYQVWKGQGKTILDSGFVLKDVELQAKKNPKGVLKNLTEYMNKKTVTITKKSPDTGDNNFMNICDN